MPNIRMRIRIRYNPALEVTLTTLTILWRRRELADTCLDLNIICSALAFRVLCECIDGVLSDVGISELFADKSRELYNSVLYRRWNV